MSTATLIIRTGLQGHGKTLNTIKEVDTKAFKEGRPVYFHNITDLEPSKLKADWFPFDDPQKWYELPNDSIIVVDEAQGFFPVRDPRKEVPEYASRFEIMRKQGHEVHLITQDPRFIDVHVRRLCGSHIHYNRVFGSSNVARYQCERVVNEVEKLPANKTADRTIIKLDKNYFGVYSSAQAQHHFKFKPSKKAVFFAVATVVTIWLCYRVFDMFYGSEPPPEEPASASPASSVAAAVSSSPFASLLDGPTQIEDRPMSRADYLASLEPRIPDIPSTAPVYDSLTAPQSHPRLYCMSSSDPKLLSRSDAPWALDGTTATACQCYTQQGTRVATTFEFCLNTVKRGYFDNTRPDAVTTQLQQPGYQSAPAHSLSPSSVSLSGHPSSSPVPGQATVPQSSYVTVVEYEKGRFAW
ncbi:MAG: zonular occludens toxin [Pseudomonadales bacterium]|nr:zonular occludens toxin [Pseudomonadales bacterium]|tara:strand:+ start:12963 stop:14195 length:1233 start_codon:yes stop_codon:yes gene_type:complete